MKQCKVESTRATPALIRRYVRPAPPRSLSHRSPALPPFTRRISPTNAVSTQLRRELGIPSLNASDVDRGLDRLTGRGYLGSGPAHAWFSSVVPNPAGEEGGAAVAGSKTVAAAATFHAFDLKFGTRALDFDDLVPTLLHPARYAAWETDWEGVRMDWSRCGDGAVFWIC